MHVKTIIFHNVAVPNMIFLHSTYGPFNTNSQPGNWLGLVGVLLTAPRRFLQGKDDECSKSNSSTRKPLSAITTLH